jgi:hypothetical protein
MAKWLYAFGEFWHDMSRHWVGKMTGLLSVILAVVPLVIPTWFAGDMGLWLTRRLWWGGAAVSFFIASRLAWDEQRKKRKELEDKIDILKPKLGFSADPQGFYLAHLGGEAARFIEIDPITNMAGSSVHFDPIDFIEMGNKLPPSYRLAIFLDGATPADMGKIIFMMCHRFGDQGDVTFPVTIRFQWNGTQLEERINLRWVSMEGRFETKPQ